MGMALTFKEAQSIQYAPFVPGLLNFVQCAIHGLDAPERLLDLGVVVQLAD
jgi:hypothetical protein